MLQAYITRSLSYESDALNGIVGALNTFAAKGVYHTWGVPWRMPFPESPTTESHNRISHNKISHDRVSYNRVAYGRVSYDRVSRDRVSHDRKGPKRGNL
jgi:hypothetical protein